MCGILGSINFPIKESLHKIKHRGPDFQSSHDFNTSIHNVRFGHTRLSILDLSEAGNQPMLSEDGNYSIIFNGEIYNHLELRKKLSEFNFKGHSDTETILYYLVKFGIEGIKDFNGIFAFSFLDLRNQMLYLVRDPFGVKPLYYHFSDNGLIFSSEISPIHHIGVKKEINKELLSTFLRLRYLPSPYSLYKDISKVKPGEYISIDLRKTKLNIRKQTYVEIPEINTKISFNDALNIYEEKLKNAVDRQLMSDVPISFLLSGGVDSALLAKLIKHDSNYDVMCYTAGYNVETEIDEMNDAAASAKHLGLKQQQIILSEKEFLEKLPELIKIIEEPLGSQSIFPIFFLTESIKNDGYKVAISGQGIDEPMGGYKKYRAQNFISNIKRIPVTSAISKKFSNFKNDDLRRIFKSISAKDNVGQIKESTSFFDESMLNKLFNSKQLVEKDISDDIIVSRIEEYNIENKNTAEIMMNLDARMNLPDDLLLYTDKISMRNSIELRVPFLDIDLVNFLESLPSKYKVNLKSNKILHKKLSEKHLPKEIVYRKKKAFYTPRKIWFKGKFGDHFLNEMKNDNGLFSELFNVDYIESLFEYHKTGNVNYEKQLYIIIIIYLWIKTSF